MAFNRYMSNKTKEILQTEDYDEAIKNLVHYVSELEYENSDLKRQVEKIKRDKSDKLTNEIISSVMDIKYFKDWLKQREEKIRDDAYDHCSGRWDGIIEGL